MIRTAVPDVAAAFAQPDTPDGRTEILVEYANHREGYADGTASEDGRFLIIAVPDKEDIYIPLNHIVRWSVQPFAPLAWGYAGK